MPLRRNGITVAPERPPRCAGTVIPLRRNRHPVAPEPPRAKNGAKRTETDKLRG